MRKYLCRFPGCGELLDKPGYCGQHRRPAAAPKAPPFENAQRSNYYGSSRWKSLARQAIRKSPQCAVCGVGKADGAILEAHHREPPRGDEEMFFDENNIMVLCQPCHRVVTAREIQERKMNR
jgi:5-methylcytosine-specific restriction protein A